MQFSTLAAITALAATVSAGYNGTVVYTTEVHTAYTTVCPASTELTFNGVTYTATEVSFILHIGDATRWKLQIALQCQSNESKLTYSSPPP